MRTVGSINLKNNSPAFGNGIVSGALASGILTNGLQIIKQNPIAEIAALDIGTMAAPRIAIESGQNPDYGIESAFREVAPIALNPFGPGIVGAAMMFMAGFSGVNLGNQAINTLKEHWENAGGKNFSPENPDKKIVNNFTRSMLKKVTGSVGSDPDVNEFKPLKDAHINELSQKLDDAILGKHSRKEKNALLKEVREKFVAATKAESDLKLGEYETNAGEFFDNIVTTGRKLFTKHAPEKLEQEISKLKHVNKWKTGTGAVLSIAALCVLPPINNYLTKKRTGKDGYAAYKDFNTRKDADCQKTPDQIKKEKRNLNALKAVTMAGMGLLMISSMGAFGKKGFFKEGGLKNFKDKVEMKGKNASMDLVRLMYGCSLMSRLFFSRDEQEVKVTTLRDYTGFANWLVLGPFVANAIAYFGDKSRTLVNIKGKMAEEKSALKRPFKKVWHWISNVRLKSYGEAMEAIKKLPVEKQLGRKALYNTAILGGIGYSMFMLGLGMPKLTNYLTNKARERQLKKKQETCHNVELSQKNNSVSNSSLNEKNKIVFGEFLPKNNMKGKVI